MYNIKPIVVENSCKNSYIQHLNLECCFADNLRILVV